MADMEAIAASLNQLLATYGATRDQIADLLGGAADGGPQANGNFPVTTASGATVLVPSPRRIALLTGDPTAAAAVMQPILDSANAARTAAQTAATTSLAAAASAFVLVQAAPVYRNAQGVEVAQGTAGAVLDLNSWRLTLPNGVALTEGVGLQFDAPTTPDAVATGANDGIRILIGSTNRGIYFTSGPAVDRFAEIRAPWRVFVRYFAGGNVFIFDRTNRDALQLIELSDRISRDMSMAIVGADDARFKLTDYAMGSTVINTPGARRVIRPIASTRSPETAAHRFSSPGLRETVGINAGPYGGRFEWRLRFPGLSPSGGAEPMLVEALVDGVSRATVAPPVGNGEVGYATIGVDLRPSTNHLLTLMWPYGWAMEVVERRYPARAIIGGTPARPARTFHFCGDSTSMPFYAEKPSRTWWYKVAEHFGAQVAHNGYGGDVLLAERGAQYAQQVADLHILLVGVNSATAQYTLQSTRDEARGLVQGFRAVQPNASLLVLGFLYQTALDSGAFPISGDDYRAVIQAGVADANGGANVRFVNAKGAIPNTPSSLLDGTHPTDAMQQPIADFVINAINAFRPDLA